MYIVVGGGMEAVLFGLVIVEKRAQAKRAAERAGASIAAQEPR